LFLEEASTWTKNSVLAGVAVGGGVVGVGDGGLGVAVGTSVAVGWAEAAAIAVGMTTSGISVGVAAACKAVISAGVRSAVSTDQAAP
jgi:hypothetical protein